MITISRLRTVAFYVSGQLLTEDYYVVNKLAKGFVGTANIDTNSRPCMASSVAGHKRASDTVPGCYEDLDQADLLVLVGANAAWCHPVLYERMMAAKAKNPGCRVVVIDRLKSQLAIHFVAAILGESGPYLVNDGSSAAAEGGRAAIIDKNGPVRQTRCRKMNGGI